MDDPGIPRDLYKGIADSFGISTDSKKGRIATTGIPRVPYTPLLPDRSKFPAYFLEAWDLP